MAKHFDGLLGIEDISKGAKKLYYLNGAYLGDIICGDDGFWAYWPDRSKGGCFNARILHEIANLLDKLNADWEKQIEEYFG